MKSYKKLEEARRKCLEQTITEKRSKTLELTLGSPAPSSASTISAFSSVPSTPEKNQSKNDDGDVDDEDIRFLFTCQFGNILFYVYFVVCVSLNLAA